MLYRVQHEVGDLKYRLGYAGGRSGCAITAPAWHRRYGRSAQQIFSRSGSGMSTRYGAIAEVVGGARHRNHGRAIFIILRPGFEYIWPYCPSRCDAQASGCGLPDWRAAPRAAAGVRLAEEQGPFGSDDIGGDGYRTVIFQTAWRDRRILRRAHLP